MIRVRFRGRAPLVRRRRIFLAVGVSLQLVFVIRSAGAIGLVYGALILALPVLIGLWRRFPRIELRDESLILRNRFERHEFPVNSLTLVRFRERRRHATEWHRSFIIEGGGLTVESDVWVGGESGYAEADEFVDEWLRRGGSFHGNR